MSEKFGLEMTVEFWPSEEEARGTEIRDAYLGSLTEFWESLTHAIDEMMQKTVQLVPVNAPGFLHEKTLYIPATGEYIAYLTASGVAVAFYKLAKLWVELKNGRKLKVIYNGIEIEATQLTEAQFLKLAKMLNEMNKDEVDTGASRAEWRSICTNKLTKKGFVARDAQSTESIKERAILNSYIGRR